MKVELVTAAEAIKIGIAHSRLLNEGHGAFGEPDNAYENVVRIGNDTQRLSDNDLVIFTGDSPNREVLQIINLWNCSDKVLEVLNPHILIKRKEKKYEGFLKLKEEIESDSFYTTAKQKQGKKG